MSQLSDNAVTTALRTMGYAKEQQLAHAVKDPNGRVYNRTKHLKERTEMMQHWADYLDKLKQAIETNQNII